MTAITTSSASYASRLRLIVVLFVALAIVAGCSDSDEPLADEVIAQLDVANNAVADLTGDRSEEVPRNELMQAVLRAQSAGTTLRIVVAPSDGELVSAKSVVDRYGGTAISYQADQTGFEGASRDMSGSQLNRAVDAAKADFDMGESAAAFVDVIETEGLDPKGRTLARTLWLLLLIPAAVFMLSGAWSYLQARKRRVKRHAAFSDRKAVLSDWATQLGPEVESLRSAVGSSSDDNAKRIWHESQEFVSGIGPTLDAAANVGELDVAEMRIGRTAIKLRDLRRSLDALQP